jgi:DNA-binding NtrC family response regulator
VAIRAAVPGHKRSLEFLREAALDCGTLLKGIPILLVEDDAVQALDMAESLKDAGAIVIGPVANLSDAIAMARQGGCHAAILDFRLGSGDSIPIGQELYRRQTPFIIHTGYDCADMLPAQWRGCRLISKPADIGRLIRAVAALLRWKERSRPGIDTVD